jgi:hypothetical protein
MKSPLRLAIAAALCSAASASLCAEPTISDADLQRAGECAGVGGVIVLHMKEFPTRWREVGMMLAFSPTLLADSLEIPFKADPRYKAELDKAHERWRNSPSAEDFARDNLGRVNACIAWVKALRDAKDKPGE